MDDNTCFVLVILILVFGLFAHEYSKCVCEQVCCECDKNTHIYYDLGDSGKSTYHNITTLLGRIK